MARDIIKTDKYAEGESTYYLTPAWLNSVFDDVNNFAVSGPGTYIRPPQFVASVPAIFVSRDSDDTITAVGPHEITITEVNGAEELLPGLYEASYVWNYDPGTVGFAAAGFTASDTTNKLTITCDDDSDPITTPITYLDVSVIITYSNGTPAEDVVITVIVAIPIVFVDNGEDAVAVPQPLISMPYNHQPMSAPGGAAVLQATDISFLPPVPGDAESLWTLTLNGDDKSSYLSVVDDVATLTIPEVNKKFLLTLTVTKDEEIYVTTVDVYTYPYGSFMFSSWSDETAVIPPSFVTLTEKAVPVKSVLFPEPFGALTAKWGYDISDIAALNSNDDPTNYVLSYSGVVTHATWDEDLEAVMAAYGLTPNATNILTYSLVEMNDNGEDFTGLSFWAMNMAANGKILYKLLDTSVISDVGAWTNLTSNSLYLIEGVVPTGFTLQASVGPGAERYYIHLKHYSLEAETGIYVYNGALDQAAAIAQNSLAAPIEFSFNNTPLGTRFKAEVTSANGSSYSQAGISGFGFVAESSAMAIDAIELNTSQYGVKASISYTPAAVNPVGFWAIYKEISTVVSWDTNTHLSPSNSTDIAAVYSNTPTIHLPASIGKKIVATFYAIMPDGTLGAAYTIVSNAITVSTDLAQRDFSKNLGRIILAAQDLDDTSLIDGDDTNQHNACYTSFARDTYLEGVRIWGHDCTPAEVTISIQTSDTLSADEKTIALTSAEDNTSHFLDDLSIPLSAGETLVIAVQSATDPVTMDFTVELYFSPGEIVTNV